MVQLKKNETLQSGDDCRKDVLCYDCGTKFIEGEREGNYVRCPKCGGRRCARIVITGKL